MSREEAELRKVIAFCESSLLHLDHKRTLLLRDLAAARQQLSRLQEQAT